MQTHMTNSRLTDPEILETRFPVLLEDFPCAPARAARAMEGRRWRGAADPFPRADDGGHPVQPPHDGPFGLAGGEDRPSRVSTVSSAAMGAVENSGRDGDSGHGPGDVFVIETPGGGGYGKA